MHIFKARHMSAYLGHTNTHKSTLDSRRGRSCIIHSKSLLSLSQSEEMRVGSHPQFRSVKWPTRRRMDSHRNSFEKCHSHSLPLTVTVTDPAFTSIAAALTTPPAEFDARLRECPTSAGSAVAPPPALHDLSVSLCGGQ